jgi:hypothetical protein
LNRSGEFQKNALDPAAGSIFFSAYSRFVFLLAALVASLGLFFWFRFSAGWVAIPHRFRSFCSVLFGQGTGPGVRFELPLDPAHSRSAAWSRSGFLPRSRSRAQGPSAAAKN